MGGSRHETIPGYLVGPQSGQYAYRDTQGQAQRPKTGSATADAGRLQPPGAGQGRRPLLMQALEGARHGDTLIAGESVHSPAV